MHNVEVSPCHENAVPITVLLLFFSLRPVDIQVLKRLVEIVNVVPVIAKSDSLTLEERETFKQRVRNLLNEPKY